jgi:hypothetical protein
MDPMETPSRSIIEAVDEIGVELEGWGSAVQRAKLNLVMSSYRTIL